MLVLARKIGERVRIGKDIWVRVVEIDRNKVRLGIDAPRSVKVWREELIKDEKKEVASGLSHL